MNNPNPFVPKGSLLEQQSQRRSRLKLAVGCVLAVSVTGLVLTLIEGCKREAPDTAGTPPPLMMDSNPPPMDFSNTLPPTTPSNTMAMPMMPAPIVPSNNPVYLPPVPQPPTPVEPAFGGTEYMVVSGDTLEKIAKNHGVTLKALQAANPTAEPRKLHPKQKLIIPPVTKATLETGMGGTPAPESGGGQTYVVKSGDNLTKIAKKNGVTIKALRAANPSIATTDRIHVGEKLVIPGKAEAPVTPPPATDTMTIPMSPAPAPGTGH